jgi:hypothetical protein
MIKILPNNHDDLGFSEIIENIINKIVENVSPDEIFLTKIDNWFDVKWREFSGKLLGAIGFWNKELTVPPFIPDRVLEQKYFQRLNANYIETKEHNLHFYQPSSENIGRKLESFPNARTRILIWYSGNTKNSLRGCFMVYEIKEQSKDSYYVSFLKKDKWQIYKTDQISRNEVLSLMK